MRILALEPYYGGSHKAFLDGWSTRSRHEWTILGLPDRKWKWRMRHAPMTLADEVAARVENGASWDLVFCSDMLNLAEFRGLALPSVVALPSVAYFHENQLTYPVREPKEFDYHFAFSNMMTALTASRVWFNSGFHRESFLKALRDFLKRMPDHQSLSAVDRIRAKSFVRYPGIDDILPAPRAGAGPMHVLWAARWEQEKRPDVFFAAMRRLLKEGVDFRMSVIGGGQWREVMDVFLTGRKEFEGRIVHWGYLDTQEAYIQALQDADVFVSTAEHEFFGISAVEAAAAGAYPLLPRRLAYPEVFKEAECPDNDSFFYEGGAEALVDRLCELSERCHGGDLWEGQPERGRRCVQQYHWSHLVSAWDDELADLA